MRILAGRDVRTWQRQLGGAQPPPELIAFTENLGYDLIYAQELGTYNSVIQTG